MIFRKYIKKAEYFIELVGLASDSIGAVIIDEKYSLIQIHPSYITAIIPLINIESPSFNEVVFYTNCLAYLHEIPAFVRPARGKALVEPIEKEKISFTNNAYYEAIGIAYENINSLRLGSLAYVYFRWMDFEKITRLPLTLKYAALSQEISLYSTALRQLDPLSEFLNYYRVIESVSGNNGKDWILANLNRLEKYDFGFLEFEVVGKERVLKYQRRKNLFGFYRRRALLRLKTLTNRLSGRNIAEYFYNENRCGIAHSKTDIKVYDFGFNIREISQDLYILKLLARVAIDDNVT